MGKLRNPSFATETRHPPIASGLGRGVEIIGMARRWEARVAWFRSPPPDARSLGLGGERG